MNAYHPVRYTCNDSTSIARSLQENVNPKYGSQYARREPECTSSQTFVERIQVPSMSDRDRGRGHGGFHGGVRPPRGVPAYGYNQSNGITTYIDRAGPPGPASMVADGVLSSQRHSTDYEHGQWDQQVSFLQRGRYGPPVVPTPPARHINFGIGPPAGSAAMAYPHDIMRHPQYPTPLGMGLNVHRGSLEVRLRPGNPP